MTIPTTSKRVESIFDRRVPIVSSCKVSIIVPTQESSQLIPMTIESILSQRNCRFEAIFIDSESRDRTVDIIRSYADPRFRIQSVPSTNLFEMINRGIAMAQGEYIQVISPGDCFLYPDALALVSTQLSQNELPDLFYTASLMRDEWYRPHFLFRPFKKELLRSGLQPTHLHSVWIKKKVFKEVGFFDTSLSSRGALDFFIRFLRYPHLVSASESRVYVDPAIVKVATGRLVRHFQETFHLIWTNFGFIWAIRWLFIQKDTKRLWERMVHYFRQAFLGHTG
jgi:glycosyltransferase involved in cell wall biosynthesis